MSFEQEHLYGFKKYEKHFDKLCEKGTSILGNITHCGIGEVCKSGYMYVAANRPDIAETYLENKNYQADIMSSYSSNISEGFSIISSYEDLKYLWSDDKKALGEKCNIKHGFYYTEKIDNETIRHYVFFSNERQIYDVLVKNMPVIKKFVMYFKEINKKVISEMQDRKYNMSEHKDNYFTQIKRPFKTDKERAIDLFQTLELLDKNETLTDREFECLHYYSEGRTAKTIGEIFHISSRTVESHLASAKDKLHIHSRKELHEKVGIT